MFHDLRFQNLLICLFKSITDIILPELCPICSEPYLSKAEKEDRDYLCSSCLKEISFINNPTCSTCGIPFNSKEIEAHQCPECDKTKRSYFIARGVGKYEGNLLKAIHLFKYGGKINLARSLGRMLAHHPFDFSIYHLLIPVPLHIKRLKDRGFNQAVLLAKEIENVYSIPIEAFSLKRVKATKPQVALSKNDRIQNVKGAFAVKDPAVIKGRRLLLIDDVFTTGATVGECAKVLKKAGADRVDVLTLARVV